MQYRVKWFLLILAVVLALALPGYSTPVSSGRPEFPAPGTKRRVVWAMPVAPPNVVHTPVALAKEFGFMDKFNIEVEMRYFEGSTRALTAAIAGDVQLGYIDCLPAYGNGVPVVSFYGPAPKLAFLMVARDPVRTIQDLRGRKIGMASAPGGAIDRMNRAVLAAAGIRPDEVVMVQTTTAGRVPALLSGQTDTAIVHYEQASKILREARGVRIIYDLQQAMPNYHYHQMCGLRSFVEANRALVSDFAAATILAIRYAYTHRAEAIRALVKITGAEPQDVGYAYSRIVTGCVWARNLGLNMRALQWTIDFHHEGGVLRNRYRAETAFDMQIAQEALRKAGGPVKVPDGCE